MKYADSKQFLDSDNKKLLIIGLSGVGKTTLANMLAEEGWGQYSIDYHIGNRFLGDEIHKLFEEKITDSRFMHQVTKHQAIDPISNKPIITKTNLYPISAYVSMVGHPDMGGISEQEFRQRLKNHLSAEVAATLDMVKTSTNSQENFVSDASGSLCEIVDPDTDGLIMQALSDFTVIYIESTKQHDSLLIERQRLDPKPLYYRQEFLDEHIPLFLEDYAVSSIDDADPADVGSWMLPRLIATRRKRYDKIIDRLGYKLSMEKTASVKSADELNRLIAEAIDEQ